MKLIQIHCPTFCHVLVGEKKSLIPLLLISGLRKFKYSCLPQRGDLFQNHFACIILAQFIFFLPTVLMVFMLISLFFYLVFHFINVPNYLFIFLVCIIQFQFRLASAFNMSSNIRYFCMSGYFVCPAKPLFKGVEPLLMYTKLDFY